MLEELVDRYDNHGNSIRWASSLSDPFDTWNKTGVLTSPRLFCLYMDQLIDELSSTLLSRASVFYNISYADDMVLLSPSVCALRRLVDACESYAETQGPRHNI